jgi:hypothetical protein
MSLVTMACAWLSIALLFPAQVSGANPRNLVWQEGERASRKTVLVDRATLQKQYVYRVQSVAVRYVVVVSDVPIYSELHAPVQFAVTRKDLFIRDSEGRSARRQFWKRRRDRHAVERSSRPPVTWTYYARPVEGVDAD